MLLWYMYFEFYIEIQNEYFELEGLVVTFFQIRSTNFVNAA